MKKFFVLFVVLVFLLAAGAVMAETKITVGGTGEVRVSADTAIISLGVNARDKDVLKAQQKANETIAAIRTALIEKNVKAENINTEMINIYALYDYQNDREQISAYNANSSLAIKVTDMESVGVLIDEAFAAGANTLNGISFSAFDTEEAKKEALQKAVAEAHRKAEILAETIGLKITKIESVSEDGIYNYENNIGGIYDGKMETEEAVTEPETVVQAAKLIISASVHIVFSTD